MVAPLFFALLFAIIEVAMIFFASQVLETVTQDSARFIMTGQAQGASYTQQQFKDFVCGRVSTLFDCTNGIYVDVRSYPAATGFSSVNITPPIDGANAFVPTMKWCPGKDGDGALAQSARTSGLGDLAGRPLTDGEGNDPTRTG